MLSQSVKHLMIFSIASSIPACNTQETGLEIDPTQSKVSSQNFEKEIPIEKAGRRKGALDFYYEFLKEDLSALKIGSLELGYDSLHLRVWLGHELAIKRNLVIIKSYDSKWHADLVIF